MLKYQNAESRRRTERHVQFGKSLHENLAAFFSPRQFSSVIQKYSLIAVKQDPYLHNAYVCLSTKETNEIPDGTVLHYWAPYSQGFDGL